MYCQGRLNFCVRFICLWTELEFYSLVNTVKVIWVGQSTYQYLYFSCAGLVLKMVNQYLCTYEGCSKWIAYFYLETSNFKLAQKYSFHALEVLPVARNAKFQPMYPLLEGVTVRWFGHSNKVLMNGRSKCLSGLVFPPSKECFQFRKQKEITRGKVWGIRGVRQNSYFFFLQKGRNYWGGMSWGIVM